jgi:hypothetical protein
MLTPRRSLSSLASLQLKGLYDDFDAALGASPRSRLLVRPAVVTRGGPVLMLHAGLDLSRTGVDVHVMDEAGAPVLGALPPDLGHGV